MFGMMKTLNTVIAVCLLCTSASSYEDKNRCKNLVAEITQDSPDRDEVELLIGDNFTMTCTGSKAVVPHGCGRCSPPTHGLAIWYCRQDNITLKKLSCLWDQFFDDPDHTYLEFDGTSKEFLKSDTSANFTSSFEITNGQVNDSDTYFCVVGTEDDCFTLDNLSHSSVKVTFQMGVKPWSANLSRIPSLPIKGGDQVKLTCSAFGYPTPHYTWFHNGNQINGSGQFLNFDSITRKDNGHYHCKVSNIEGWNTTEVIRIDIPPDEPYWKKLAVYIVFSFLAGIIVVITCIYLMCKRCWRDQSSPTSSSARSNEHLLTPECMSISGDNNRVFIASVINIHAGRNIPVPENDVCSNSLFVVYNDASQEDKSHAEQIKEKMRVSPTNNFSVTMWGDRHLWEVVLHRGLVRLLSRKIQKHKYIVLVRTRSFIEESEGIFMRALQQIDESERSFRISNIIIISHDVSQNLPELLENGPKSMSFSDCESFWQEFRNYTVAVTRSLSELNVDTQS